MNNDDARKYFDECGLTYEDLNIQVVQKLRYFVNKEMVESGLYDGQYRCKQRAFRSHGYNHYEHRFYGIKCNSDDWKDRECVSFNQDGFIGFAGWASTRNTAPILKGFVAWCDWMVERKRIQYSNTRKHRDQGANIYHT